MSTPTNKNIIKKGPNSTGPIRQSLLTPLRQMGLSRKVKPPKSIEALLKGNINSPVDNKCISAGLSRKSFVKNDDKKGSKTTPVTNKDSDQSSRVSLGLNEETPKGRKFASKNEAASSKTNENDNERVVREKSKNKLVNDDDEKGIMPTVENDGSSEDDKPLKRQNAIAKSKRNIKERLKAQRKTRKNKFIDDAEEEVIPLSESDSCSSEDEPLKKKKATTSKTGTMSKTQQKTKKKNKFIDDEEEERSMPTIKNDSRTTNKEEKSDQINGKTVQNITQEQKLKTDNEEEISEKSQLQNEEDEEKSQFESTQTQTKSRRKNIKRNYIIDDDSEDENNSGKKVIPSQIKIISIATENKENNSGISLQNKIVKEDIENNENNSTNEIIFSQNKIVSKDTKNDENSLAHSNKRKLSPNPKAALSTKISNSDNENLSISKRKKCKISENNVIMKDVIIRIQGIENNKEIDAKKKPVRRMLSLKKSISSMSTNSAASEDNSQHNVTGCSSTLDELNDLKIQSQVIAEETVVSKEDLETLKDEVYNLAVDIHLKEEQLAELKQAVIYRKLHDVNELREQTNLWKKGCQDALEVLLTKLKTHYPVTMQQVLGRLNIPPELIGYDLNEERFNL